jgi:hypothetical protein
MHASSIFVTHTNGILEVLPEFTKSRVRSQELEFVLEGRTLTGIVLNSGGRSAVMGEANIYKRSFPYFLANEIQACISHLSAFYARGEVDQLCSDI